MAESGDSPVVWGFPGEPTLTLEKGKGESGFARVKKSQNKGVARQWMARTRGKDHECIGY